MKINKNIFKSIITYIILIIAFLFKGSIINLFANIKYFTNDIKCNNTENIILKENINNLNKQIESLTNISNINNYNYSLTKMSYRSSYNSSLFYIVGGFDNNYKINDLLINENGVVGIIKEVYDNYSIAKFIYDVDNITVEINGEYGILNKSENNYLIINNFSNYDNISINDDVYTSILGDIKERLFIGKVSKIIDNNYEKIIYVKSNIDINNISYLYVVGSL